MSPLADADVAAYNAKTGAFATVDARRLKNTILQTDGVAAADGNAVNPDDVHNGQYLDFKRYQTRHSLALPKMCVIGGGTNDATNWGGTAAALEQAFYDGLVSWCRRWYSSFPTAPILFWLTVTGREPNRNDVWTNKYIPILRGVLHAQQVVRALGIPLVVCPMNALAPTATGYNVLGSSTRTMDGDTQSYSRNMADPIHPGDDSDGTGDDWWEELGAARTSAFKQLSMYMSCMYQGLITY